MKKIKIEAIKINSFITSMENKESKTIVGGTRTSSLMYTPILTTYTKPVDPQPENCSCDGTCDNQ